LGASGGGGTECGAGGARTCGLTPGGASFLGRVLCAAAAVAAVAIADAAAAGGGIHARLAADVGMRVLGLRVKRAALLVSHVRALYTKDEDMVEGWHEDRINRKRKRVAHQKSPPLGAPGASWGRVHALLPAPPPLRPPPVLLSMLPGDTEGFVMLRSGAAAAGG
jgi:hypothetical protein